MVSIHQSSYILTWPSGRTEAIILASLKVMLFKKDYMMTLSMVEIRQNDARDPIPVLLPDVLKYNSACMLNSKRSCSFSARGTMKCLCFSFFSISEKKLQDLLWGAK